MSRVRKLDYTFLLQLSLDTICHLRYLTLASPCLPCKYISEQLSKFVLSDLIPSWIFHIVIR